MDREIFVLPAEPKVSVIIPAFNCEKYIQKAMDSILEQTYQNIEIVIADDGSTDRTKELIDNYEDPRIRRFHNKENLGNVRTRNKLFLQATGDLLTIQDADDWSSPQRLEEQVTQLKMHFPGIRAVGTAFKLVHQDNTKSDLQKSYPNEIYEINIQAEELGFVPASIMIHKSIYDQVGGLDLYFERLVGEDNYWIRKILVHSNCLIINKPLYFYRFNPNSLTKKIDNPRLLVIPKVRELLSSQLREFGSDWLSEGKVEQLKEYEAKILKDKKYMSDRYRQFAAIAFNQKNFEIGWRYLYTAFLRNPFNTRIYRTFFYGVRRKVGLV